MDWLAGKRQWVHRTLEAEEDEDQTTRLVNWCLIVLISLNLLAVTLESVPSLGGPYRNAFLAFEVFSVAIFSVEYGLRLWSAVEWSDGRYRHPVFGRLRYAFTPLAIIDLLAILPFYLSVLIGADLLFLRALRLLRIFKLTRYSNAWRMLQRVSIAEARPIGAALFVLGVLVVVAACLTYLVEHEAQPEAFGSIPQAIWWAIITMTTVGYGDVVPVTFWGKVLAACIGIMGIGMVALPAGFLASGFTTEVHRRQHATPPGDGDPVDRPSTRTTCPRCGHVWLAQARGPRADKPDKA